MTRRLATVLAVVIVGAALAVYSEVINESDPTRYSHALSLQVPEPRAGSRTHPVPDGITLVSAEQAGRETE